MSYSLLFFVTQYHKKHYMIKHYISLQPQDWSINQLDVPVGRSGLAPGHNNGSSHQVMGIGKVCDKQQQDLFREGHVELEILGKENH